VPLKGVRRNGCKAQGKYFAQSHIRMEFNVEDYT